MSWAGGDAHGVGIGDESGDGAVGAANDVHRGGPRLFVAHVGRVEDRLIAGVPDGAGRALPVRVGKGSWRELERVWHVSAQDIEHGPLVDAVLLGSPARRERKRRPHCDGGDLGRLRDGQLRIPLGDALAGKRRGVMASKPGAVRTSMFRSHRSG